MERQTEEKEGSGKRFFQKMPHVNRGLNDLLKNLKERRTEAKPLHELVVSEDFHVREVISESGSTTGYKSSIELKVYPSEGNGSGVKTLYFLGNSIVQAGDNISAQIPKFETEIEHSRQRVPYKSDRHWYYDRPFKEKEEAIELRISRRIEGEDKEVRTDRSGNYSKYQEKK